MADDWGTPMTEEASIPLKNMKSVGKDYPMYYGKIKMFQTTNQISVHAFFSLLLTQQLHLIGQALCIGICQQLHTEPQLIR